MENLKIELENGVSLTCEFDSAIGPRVIVEGEIEADQIEANLPEGWTVGENWHLENRLSPGRCSYPLVES